jgi:hypothetical protein
MHIRLDHAEPESEFRVGQVQWVFRNLQASSYDDANIVVIHASPGAFSHDPCLLFLKLSLCEVLVVIKL